MFNDYYTKNLDKNEAVIKVVRRHGITLVGPIIFSAVFILADFFLLTWFFSQGWWTVLVFFSVLLFFALIILRAYIIWSQNCFVITDRRVIDIDQHGIFYKVVSECNYEKIQDVSYSVKGLLATLFQFGKIEIQTAGEVPNLELNFIKNPAKIQEVIMTQQRIFPTRPKALDDNEIDKAELIQTLNKVKKELGEEQFRNLLRK